MLHPSLEIFLLLYGYLQLFILGDLIEAMGDFIEHAVFQSLLLVS